MKLFLKNILSRYGSVDALNQNFNDIETALNNTLSRDGTGPNEMLAPLDMNHKNILNGGTAYVDSLVLGGVEVEVGASVSVASVFQRSQFTTLAGQTAFDLSPNTPTLASTVATVNGLTIPPSDLGISGNSVVIPSVQQGDEVVILRFLRDVGGVPDASLITYTPSGSNVEQEITNTKAAIDTAKTELYAMYPGKNRIINGDCRIAQRGTTVLVSAAVNRFGGPDRFVAASVTAGAGSFNQVQGTMVVDGATKSTVRHVVNTPPTFSGSGYFSGISQFIEGTTISDLTGKQVTLSFIFKSNVTGTFAVALTQFEGGSSSYVSTFNAVADTPVYVTLTPPGLPRNVSNNTSLAMVVSIGAIGASINNATALNAWISANRQQAVGTTNWATAANNYIEVTELQLEEGNQATAFERRLPTMELALCQRYYSRLQGSIAFVAASGTHFASNGVQYPVRMRVTPTLANEGALQLMNLSGSTLFENVTETGFRYTAIAAAAGSVIAVEVISASAEV